MRSSYWMVLNSGLIKMLALITQVILSLLLAKEDFGVYAVALSVTALLTNFRGGGSLQWVIQGGRIEYTNRAGDAFWISLLINTLLGCAIMALANPAAAFFGDERISSIILISGAAFPLLTLSSFSKATLAIDLKMKQITWIEIAGAVIRTALTILLAFSGFGPLSFVLPLPVAYIVEGLIALHFTAERPWRLRASPLNWGPIILGNRWIMAGTFVATLGLQADYIVLGRLADLSLIGVYFFAYQLTYMSASLVTTNIRRALFPGLVATPPERRGAAAISAARTITIIGAPLLMVLACVIAPLEDIIWQGKWSDAVVVIQILSITLPLELLTTITQSSLQSQGKFRMWTGVNLARACAVTGGATTAGLLYSHDVTHVALIMAISFAVANGIQIQLGFRRLGIGLTALLKQVGIPLALAPMALVVTLTIQSAVPLGVWLATVLAVLVFFGTYMSAAFIFARSSITQATQSIRTSLRS